MSTTNGGGWFKATRGQEPMEVICANPLAYVLAAVIAHRSNWRGGFNQHGLAAGEAFLGDHKRCGMSEQQYRTAKLQLEKWGFATFKATNKGTIGSLRDTRLFSVLTTDANEQGNGQPTDSQRTANGQLTTNEELKNKEEATHTHPQPEIYYPEIPSWEAVKDRAAMIGLPEWRARLWFDEMEAVGWRDKNGRPIRKWQNLLATVKAYWEADGRPASLAESPQGRRPTPRRAPGSATSPTQMPLPKHTTQSIDPRNL